MPPKLRLPDGAKSLGVVLPEGTPKKKGKAKGRHTPGVMNGTEKRYEDEHLTARLRAGQDIAWWFERIKFKIGHDCHYTPDFLVREADMSLWIVETKGGNPAFRDESRTKFKTVLDQYPFLHGRWAEYRKKEWHVEEF